MERIPFTNTPMAPRPASDPEVKGVHVHLSARWGEVSCNQLTCPARWEIALVSPKSMIPLPFTHLYLAASVSLAQSQSCREYTGGMLPKVN
jgi:hypothetical protein